MCVRVYAVLVLPIVWCGNGLQVVLFGGQAFNASAAEISLSTVLYVLDFSSNIPRWRKAVINLNNQGAFVMDYPNTGVVMLPEHGAVALKHRSVRAAAWHQTTTVMGVQAKISCYSC